MKAVVFDRYGPPEVLHVTEAEKPAAADDEILIRVHAAEATKSDGEMRRCKFAVKWYWLLFRLMMGITRPRRRHRILGFYFSGVVESVGSKVGTFKAGDAVFGASRLRLGAYGEYVAVPESYPIVPKPSSIGFEEAAAVPLGGLNALHFMRKGNIRQGEKVLVNGAGGSIGLFSVQIARSMGAEVTAVDKADKLEMLRSIGADHVIDYTREDFTQSGKTYDVILSTVAGTSYSGVIASLNSGGRYLIANPRLSDMLRAWRTSRSGDRKAIFAFAQETKEELLALGEMIDGGRIKPVMDRVFPMEQAAEAHRMVETEERLGAIVIKVAPDQAG